MPPWQSPVSCLPPVSASCLLLPSNTVHTPPDNNIHVELRLIKTWPFMTLDTMIDCIRPSMCFLIRTERSGSVSLFIVSSSQGKNLPDFPDSPQSCISLSNFKAVRDIDLCLHTRHHGWQYRPSHRNLGWQSESYRGLKLKYFEGIFCILTLSRGEPGAICTGGWEGLKLVTDIWLQTFYSLLFDTSVTGCKIHCRVL